MRERGRPIAIPRLEQSCDNDTGLDRIKGADPYSGPCGISAGHCRLTQYQNTPGPPLLLRLHEITSDGRNVIRFRGFKSRRGRQQNKRLNGSS